MSTQDNINTIMETITPEMYFVLVSLNKREMMLYHTYTTNLVRIAQLHTPYWVNNNNRVKLER